MYVTVNLGDKERFNKEQIGFKELCTDYQPFYSNNLLLCKSKCSNLVLLLCF